MASRHQPMNSPFIREASAGREASEPGFLSRPVTGWIVCAGATREVSRGQVNCPRDGVISAVECLACHLLVTIAHERNSRMACSTVD